MYAIQFLAFFDIQHVQNWMQTGGYVALFGLLFACGLGLPCPEDIPLTVSGILIAQGHMHFAIAAPLAWLGIIGGDCCLYFLGYRFGHNITKVPVIGHHVTLERIKKAEVLFAKYGVGVVAVGRLFAGVRGGMVIAAGTTRFKFIKFLIADGLAACVSGGMFMLLGHWFGSNLTKLESKVSEFRNALIITGSVAAVFLIAYIWWRSTSHKSIGDAVADKAEEIAEESENGPKARVVEAE